VAVWVGLLRAVNVGGRKLAMADLRAAVEGLGFTGVRTYVQSGNVVFDAPGRKGEAALVRELEAALADAKGRIPVVLRTRAELDAVLAGDPYAGRRLEPTHHHVVFLPGAAAHALDGVDLAAYAPEEAVVVGREVHLLLPFGAGRSKLAVDLARKGTKEGTARNWRTVTALAAVAAEVAGAA
jgi:uncharacterized protein (DUF1697 family)